jgi:hypothetical protein
VESESDEDPGAEEPRLRGALRGLDMGNMLAPPDTRYSPDAGEERRRSMTADTPQHETRASRHGKAAVNYSAKWHPMDEVMRPKRARGLTGGSTSRRRAADDSDDSEPEPFSGGDTGDEDDEDETPDTSFEREPDAKATRRSARSEALKPVNYSKAHHPQDHLLPGYRNKAKRQRRSTSATQPRKRKTSGETVILSSQTIADSEDDDDGSDADEDDCIQLQAADPTTATTSSPGEQLEQQSAQEDRTMPPDVAEDSHHLLKAVPGLSRDESSFGPVVQGLLGQVDGSALDSQQSSQAINPGGNLSDEDEMDNQSTKAIMSGVTAIFASLQDPAAIGSDQVAGKHVEEAPVPDRHSVLHVSDHATTSLLTPSSAMDKSTQAGSLGLTIVRPYSTPQVESSVKGQPSSSQQSKGADVLELDVKPNDDDRLDAPAKSQERNDTLNDQDHPSQTEKHESSDAAPQHRMARTEQTSRGFSDLSSRAGIASYDHGDRMTAISPASRQASRDTNPEDILAKESFFNDATSSSQTGSKGSHDDEEAQDSTVATPKSPASGQQQVEGNALGVQLDADGQPLASAGDDRSHQHANGAQEEAESEEARESESADGSKGIQPPTASSAHAEALSEAIASSSTEFDDNLLLAENGM